MLSSFKHNWSKSLYEINTLYHVIRYISVRFCGTRFYKLPASEPWLFYFKLATQTRGTSEFIPLYNWSHMGDCVWQISLFLKRRLSFLFPFSFIFICHYDHILGFHFNIHVQWGLNQVNRFWVKLLSFIPSPQKLYLQLCPVTSVI
jgi:hypothetical protein